MTQDDVIEMAREAGLDWDIGWVLNVELPNRFETFANLVAAKEREACAKLVEESSLPDTYSQECLPDIANEIRARGEQA